MTKTATHREPFVHPALFYQGPGLRAPGSP